MALRSLPFLILVALGCDRRTPQRDVEGQIAAYGVNCSKMLSSAYGSVEGLKGFFLLAGCTDAAGSEDYSADVERLPAFYGDARFAQAVESTTSTIRGSIVSHLGYISCYGEHEGEWRKFRSRFPQTSLLVSPQ